MTGTLVLTYGSRKEHRARDERFDDLIRRLRNRKLRRLCHELAARRKSVWVWSPSHNQLQKPENVERVERQLMEARAGQEAAQEILDYLVRLGWYEVSA